MDEYDADPAAEYDEYTGQRFGKLVVLRFAGATTKDGLPRYACRCDCGNTVYVRLSSLQSGNTRSCGCLRKGKSGRRWPRYVVTNGPLPPRPDGQPGTVLGVKWTAAHPLWAKYNKAKWMGVCAFSSPLEFARAAIAEGYELGMNVLRKDCRHPYTFGNLLIRKGGSRNVDPERWGRKPGSPLEGCPYSTVQLAERLHITESKLSSLLYYHKIQWDELEEYLHKVTNPNKRIRREKK